MDSLGRLSKIAEALEKACGKKFILHQTEEVVKLKQDLEKEWTFMVRHTLVIIIPLTLLYIIPH